MGGWDTGPRNGGVAEARGDGAGLLATNQAGRGPGTERSCRKPTLEGHGEGGGQHVAAACAARLLTKRGEGLFENRGILSRESVPKERKRRERKEGRLGGEGVQAAGSPEGAGRFERKMWKGDLRGSGEVAGQNPLKRKRCQQRRIRQRKRQLSSKGSGSKLTRPNCDAKH